MRIACIFAALVGARLISAAAINQNVEKRQDAESAATSATATASSLVSSPTDAFDQISNALPDTGDGASWGIEDLEMDETPSNTTRIIPGVQQPDSDGQPTKVKKTRSNVASAQGAGHLEARAPAPARDTHADRPVKRTDVPRARVKRAVAAAAQQDAKVVKRADPKPVIKRRKSKVQKKRAPQSVQQHPARGDARGIKAQQAQRQRGQQLLNANGDPVRIQGGSRQPVRVAVQPPPPHNIPPPPEATEMDENEASEEPGENDAADGEDGSGGFEMQSMAAAPPTDSPDSDNDYVGAAYSGNYEAQTDPFAGVQYAAPPQGSFNDAQGQNFEENDATAPIANPSAATVTVYAPAETVTVTKAWHLFGRQLPTGCVTDPYPSENVTIGDANATATDAVTDFDYGAATPTPTTIDVITTDGNPNEAIPTDVPPIDVVPTDTVQTDAMQTDAIQTDAIQTDASQSDMVPTDVVTIEAPPVPPPVYQSYASVNHNIIPLVQRVGRLPHKSRRIHEFRARAMGLEPPSNDTAGLVGAAMDAEYLVNVAIGGQTMQLILDTGSSDTWVIGSGLQCVDNQGQTVPADTCQFGNATYNQSLSSSYAPYPVAANFNVSYGDGSYAIGSPGFETITVANITATNATFAVVNESYWTGDGVSSGLLGLAYPTLTDVYVVLDPSIDSRANQMLYNPWFSQAVAQNVTAPYFTLQLNRGRQSAFVTDSDDLGLGSITFGERPEVSTMDIAATVPLQQQSYISANGTQSTSAYTYYVINVDQYGYQAVTAKLNATSIATNNTILDSGTTLNYLRDDLVAAFNGAFSPPSWYDEDQGIWKADCSATAPIMKVMIGNETFSIDPKDQVLFDGGIDMFTGDPTCISGTQNGGPDGSMFIFGTVFLHNVIATFDIGKNTVQLVQRPPY